MAAKAIKITVRSIDRKRSGLLLVKRTQPGVVLSPGFAELQIVADDAHDVGLLLDELGEVVGHRRGWWILSPLS